ncbi:MAG: hypothetical protein GF320_15140 [Armatimonadia bacterium]|nr:hypothetical protein [Armatimonadia bacterium]
MYRRAWIKTVEAFTPELPSPVAPLECVKDLLDETREEYGAEDHMVHCVAFCRAKERCGGYGAEAGVYLTEPIQLMINIKNWIVGNPHRHGIEHRDYINNRIGRRCGSKVATGTVTSCHDCCAGDAIPPGTSPSPPPPGPSPRGGGGVYPGKGYYITNPPAE